jgi:sirohydrochlorin ferrochelatase
VSVLACSHGTASPVGQRAVSALVDAVAADLPDEVAAAFVDVQEPDVPTALGGLAGHVRIVPLLLSAGFHVYVDLTEAAEARPDTVLAPALGPDPRLVAVLVDRLAAAGLGPDDTVVLAAAGSSDARALRDCEATAAMLGEAIGREVVIGYLSAAEPTLVDAVTSARGSGRVVVATYLLAPGYFATQARRCGADVVTDPLLLADEPPPRGVVDVVRDRALAPAQ